MCAILAFWAEIKRIEYPNFWGRLQYSLLWFLIRLFLFVEEGWLEVVALLEVAINCCYFFKRSSDDLYRLEHKGWSRGFFVVWCMCPCTSPVLLITPGRYAPLSQTRPLMTLLWVSLVAPLDSLNRRHQSELFWVKKCS